MTTTAPVIETTDVPIEAPKKPKTTPIVLPMEPYTPRAPDRVPVPVTAPRRGVKRP